MKRERMGAKKVKFSTIVLNLKMLLIKCRTSRKKSKNVWTSKQRLFHKNSIFIRPNHGNACKVEVREKRVNLGDGEGLQVPCTLQFS